MWLFQLLIFLNGMETIRKFIDFCGPVVYLVMFALAIWILTQTGTSSLSLQLSRGSRARRSVTWRMQRC